MTFVALLFWEFFFNLTLWSCSIMIKLTFKTFSSNSIIYTQFIMSNITKESYETHQHILCEAIHRIVYTCKWYFFCIVCNVLVFQQVYKHEKLLQILFHQPAFCWDQVYSFYQVLFQKLFELFLDEIVNGLSALCATAKQLQLKC